MKVMDVSIEDDDCTIETVTSVKKKKMKQAQLPFHTSSSSKSLNTNTVSNKKKRKITTPLVGCKSPKILKFTTKENSVKTVSEDEKEEVEETKLNSSSDSNEIILDEEKKDLDKDNQQNHEKNKKIDTTPSKNSLGKSRKLDKSQQKTGALKKFLKKTEKKAKSNTNHDNSSCELKREQEEHQTTSVRKERNEICLNEDSSKQSSEPQANKKLDYVDIAGKDTNHSLCQELNPDIVILSLSSDNEATSELDKTTSSKNEEINSKSTTPTTPKTNKNLKEKIKQLTPKQLEKRREIAKRKEEKLRLKEEKEKQREEEKANRQKQREKKQREKEEKERIEKEQRKKERELKELKKQIEIEQKQKEKEAKEEERRKREEAKEEEKRKKEEEKLEAERKKQKAASNFASFFVSKKQEVKSAEEENIVEAKNFMPFEVKADMRIAPVCRRILSEREKLVLDDICNVDSGKSELYLQDIQIGKIFPRTSSKTWPLEAKDNDIILLDEDNDGSSKIITDMHKLEKHRPKLLQFCENRRPPYWGTWQKQSNVLKSRRPFAKDEKWFDYEIDSDDEWEEEEPGESLKGSDDEKDEENPEENEYDVDNEFMVPHGYLSDEEAQAGEEEMEDMSPQIQKMKLKILGEQFEAERNAKTYKLQPKIIGCIWQERKNSFPESISAKVKEFLSARQAWVNNIPIILPSSISTEDDNLPSTENKVQTPQSARGPKKTKFPNEALPDLIRLLHGNTYGRHFLMKEFMTFWSKNHEKLLSKVSVLEKINEIANKVACPEEGPMHLKSCWYVSEDYRKQYLPNDELSLPNRWNYILTPSRKSTDTQDITDKVDKADKVEKEERGKEKEKKHVSLITQFTKKITQEEMKKQLKSDQEETKKQVSLKLDQVSVSPKPPVQRPPKRATLISVGRGEQFPEKSRERILAKFVSLNKKEEEPSSSGKMNIDSEDVIIIEDLSKDKTEGEKESTN